MDRLNVLQQAQIFQALSAEEKSQLSQRLQPCTFGKEDCIVTQGAPGDAMYIITEGRVKVAITDDKGKQAILCLLHKGEIFGEMSLLDGEPRSASVIALESTEVWRLNRSDFITYLRSTPTLALKVLEELCTRLRRADELIGNLSLLDVSGRVARLLLQMAKETGIRQPGGYRLEKRPSHQDLASMVGTSRESVSRVMAELQRRGAIRTDGRAVIIYAD